MRFIPTQIYGIKDYIAIVLLIASPWLSGFAEGGAETWVIVAVGIVGLLHTIITRMELGLFKLIAMSKHLYMDAGAGVFLIAAPWLFRFHDRVWIPYVVFGVFEIIVSSLALRGPRERTDAAAVEVIHPQRVQ